MEILYDLIPLHLFIKYEAIASLARNTHCISLNWLGHNPSFKTYIGHRKFWTDALSTAHLSLSQVDRIHELNWHRNYNVALHSLNSTSHPPLSQINVFTDGSKTNQHTGAGFVIYKQGLIIAEGARRLPPLTTVFQAEITAIQMAAQALQLLLSPEDRYVKFFTDSQAALLALHNTLVTSQLVKNAISTLNDTSRLLRCLTISWIKAHTGYEGNERADALAKSCVAFRITSNKLLPSPAIFKKLLWDYTYQLWHCEWQAQPHCRMSKNFLPKPSKAKSKLILNLSRGQMRRLIELITGHSNLNYVQHKIDPVNISPLCRFCEEEDETFAHLLNECPCFLTYRRDILNNIPIINSLSWTTRQLLEFSYIPSIEEALTFEESHN